MQNNTLSILVTAKDAASRVIEGVGKSFGSLSANAAAASKYTVTAMAAAGVAVGALGVSAIKGASDFEQSRVAFETMLGSAAKARSLMEDISKFAKETPFELPEVIAGSKQLLAFGIAQEKIIPTMRRLGDIASGVGVPVGQLTNVFGQVKVAGRLMGQDLLQFTNAGVPLIEALATTMKKPQNEIKDLVSQGKVGFPEVEKAIESLTDKGGKFGGLMEKQSHTLGGVISNLQDSFGFLLRKLVGVTNAGEIIKGGFFDKVKTAAEALLPLLDKLPEYLAKFGDFIVKNAPIIAGALAAMIAPAVVGFVMVQGPIIATGLAIAALGAAIGFVVNKIVQNMGGWQEAMQKVGNVAQTIWGAIKAGIDFLMPSFMALWGVIVNQLWPALQNLYNVIQPYIIPTLIVLGAILGGTLIAALWIVSNVLRVVIGVLSWFINVLSSIIGVVINVVQFIIAYVTFLYNFWSTIFKAIYNVVKFAFDLILIAIAVVLSLIMAVVQPVADWLSRPFRAAVDWIKGVWSGVSGWFAGIGNSIGNALSSVYNKITSPFSRAFDFVKGIPGQIVNAVGNIGQLLRDKLGNWDIPGPLGKVKDVIPGWAEGGFTGQGGKYQVAGVVHRGEYVIPKEGVDQSTGLPKNFGSSTTNFYGNIMLGDSGAVDRFFERINRMSELSEQGVAV